MLMARPSLKNVKKTQRKMFARTPEVPRAPGRGVGLHHHGVEAVAWRVDPDIRAALLAEVLARPLRQAIGGGHLGGCQAEKGGCQQGDSLQAGRGVREAVP